MRSLVCGQCHVEYYFKGPGKIVTYPWANGLKVEEIEAYYDERKASRTGSTPRPGTKVLKAQHPEFELWSQGIHARAGVACADCHMPYERVGAHQGERPLGAQPAAQRQPRLPDLPRACRRRSSRRASLTIQDRHHALLQRAARRRDRHARRHRGGEEGGARRRRSSRRRRRCTGRRSGGSTSWPPRTRWASTRPQEMARILGEAIDYARQGQLEAERAARKK